MLTQAEADQLMAMAKRFVRPPATVSIPPGADETYELAGPNNRETFLLDIWRGTIKLSKLKFQNRVRVAVVLARLDVDGAPHTNPDGVKLPGTHLHLFKEGFDDKWAYLIDPKAFTLLTDPGQTFKDFCSFCKIESPPAVQGVLT
jgi:hypothetical protein